MNLSNFTAADETSSAQTIIHKRGPAADVRCKPEADDRERFRVLYAIVASDLQQVESRFRRELHSQHELLRPLLQHGTQLGGKRLRPALLLLAAKLCGEISEEHAVLGTVIEMVHTATLVHDDVLDDADSRRHSPTINHRYNSHTSILLGDYLFAQSFRLAATLSSTRACQLLGEASRKVCEGELRQVMLRGDASLDESTYIEILSDKTAELCRIACVLGAEYAHATRDQVNALAQFGHSLGIAFQVADDYLDIWGDDRKIGKTLGTDLLQGKITLPIIRLLDQASSTDRSAIMSIVTGPCGCRLSLIRPYLNASDARQYTYQVAVKYQRDAIEALAAFDSSPTKDALVGLAELAVSREI